MAPVDDALAEVALLERELGRRRADILKHNDYYDGKHPLRFASREYRDWFGNQYSGFADNWCAPVVDALTERLRVMGVRPREARRVDPNLRRWWEESGAAADAPLAFATKAITSRVFALVWTSEDEDGIPEVTFEDPSQAVVAYVPGSRRKRRSALKMWSGDGIDYATLYTPDYVWKFERTSAEASGMGLGDPDLFTPGGARPTQANGLGGWRPRTGLAASEPWPMRNPLGVVPMVELQNRPKLLGDPLSEITGVIAMQDAINALWAYLFTAADFAALPQRVILGAQLPKIPVLNDAGQVVGHKPLDLPEANVKRILNLEGPDARIGQWDSANLETFTKVIEKAANHIGNQTRTPLYYFASSIQNISGDTLKALETGLVAKAEERMEVDDEPLREIHRLMALVAGDEQLARQVKGGTVVWRDHESRSEAQRVDALTKLKQIGFPFEYIAEKYVGGDADELERLMRMYRDQVRTDPLMLLAEREQMRNGEGEPEGEAESA